MTNEAAYRRLMGGVGLVTVGNAVAAGFGLLLLLFFARTLSPADLAVVVGIIAIIDGGQAFLDATINAGMINVATRKSQQGEPDQAILKAALVAKIIAGLVFAAIIGLLAHPLSLALLGNASMQFPIMFAGAAAAIAGLHSFVVGVLQAREDFPKIAFVSIWKNAFRIVVVAPFLFQADPDAKTAAIAICSVSIVTLILSIFMISWSFLKDRSPVRVGLGALAKVNAWMMVTALAMFGGRLDVWLVGYLSDAKSAGHFAVAAQLCVGVGLITQALMTTFLPTVSRFETAAEIRSFLRRWLRVLPLVALLPLLAWPLSGPVIRLVFGENYAASAPIFNILFLASVMTLAGAPLLLVLLSLGEARFLAFGSVVQFLLRVGLAFPMVPKAGAVGMAIADVLSRLIAISIIGYFIWRALLRSISSGADNENGQSNLADGVQPTNGSVKDA